MIDNPARVLETERLYLRELSPDDSHELRKILCDPESMKYYPAPFSEEKVEKWISWNRENYRLYGHGLWAVILKEGGTFLGDCGITMQEIEGRKLPEVGYHIKKEYGRKGYATEAARACMEYAFTRFDYESLYTYTKFDNYPSRRVAEKNSMKFVKFFQKKMDGEDIKEALYRFDRKDMIP